MTSPGASAFVYDGGPEAMFLRATALQPWADRLATHVRTLATQTTESDLRVEFDGRLYRARRNMMNEGEQFNLRVTASYAPHLSELKFKNPLWPLILLSPKLLSGGLVVFAAEMGQGKTTTAAAMVRSRLERYAGYGQTVENPPKCHSMASLAGAFVARPRCAGIMTMRRNAAGRGPCVPRCAATRPPRAAT
jgi:hypothetical protein